VTHCRGEQIGWLRTVAIGASLIALIVAAPAAASEATFEGLTVVVLEPVTDESNSIQTASVAIGDASYPGDGDFIDALAQENGNSLAILVHADVPIHYVTAITSMASKAGYTTYHVLIFDRERHMMTSLSDFKLRMFATDPETIAKLLR